MLNQTFLLLGSCPGCRDVQKTSNLSQLKQVMLNVVMFLHLVSFRKPNFEAHDLHNKYTLLYFAMFVRITGKKK